MEVIMKIQLLEILEKMKTDLNDVTVLNNNNEYISHVSFFDNTMREYNKNTLYICRNSDASALLNIPISLNIIMLKNENPEMLRNLFEDVSETLFNFQKINSHISILSEAMYSGKGLQHFVDTASELLGNPFFIRDSSFKILAFTSNVNIKDDIWNEITLKGYQDYNHYKILVAQGILDRASRHSSPIMHRFTHEDCEENGTEEEKKDVFHDDYIISFERGSNVKNILPRIWSKIIYSNRSLGYLVAVEAFKKFDDYDIALIRKISSIISIDLKNRNIPDNSIIQKQSSVLTELLEGKIKDLENLNSKLKISELTFLNQLKVVVFELNPKISEEFPLNYVKGFFVNTFKSVFSFFYKGYYLAIISSDKDPVIKDAQDKKLRAFSEDTKMLCGISRTFTGILNLKTNFNQALEAIDSGKRTDFHQTVFYYENFVTQHIIHICSKEAPLKSFCLPTLELLKEYDNARGTDFYSTLQAYSNNFNNPTELAKELNLHRNTLYYRIKKIEEIINLDLSNADNLFRVYFSFKIIDYLGADHE